HEEKTSSDPDGVALYSVSKAEEPRLVYEFPYAWTKGKINDAFLLSEEGGHDKMLFVIHSIWTPRSWDPVSDVYDVSVIRLQDGALIRDQKLSRFFGMGGDLVD
uniref:hypothetical protein n=1 Tax=Pseudomonas sp. MWU13-2100 TaxID=2935075 RepID=UPI00200C9B14